MANSNILVKSGKAKKKDGGAEIVLSETDARHPNGHALVSSPDRFTEVFPTALVREQITKGTLVEASKEDYEAAKGNAAAEKERKSPDEGALGRADSKNEKVEVREGDTVQSLVDRYNAAPLLSFAKENGIEVDQKASKAVVAEAILSAQSA